jgi:hypothetical protein
MEFEILLYSKKPCLCFLSLLYFTIGGWFGLLELFEIITLGNFSLLLISLKMRTSSAARRSL